MTQANNENTNKTILVLGSTGKTGSRVARSLRNLGFMVRAASRSGPYPFDWTDQSTWRLELEHVHAVYVTYQPDLMISRAAKAIEQFSALAKECGVQHLVLLSGRGELGAQRSEAALIKSGVDYTILRCAWFCQNFSENFLVGGVIAGEVALPASDVPEPFIDIEDIAEVAVAALTDQIERGQVFELTGPRMLSMEQAVNEISQAVSRPIQFIDVSIEDFMEGLTQQQVPEDLVSLLAELFTEVLDGRNSYLTDGVQQALGRAPRDFTEYAKITAATGVWASR